MQALGVGAGEQRQPAVAGVVGKVGLAGQAPALARDGVGDVDQLGASVDDRFEHWREEGVVGAPQNDAIGAGGQRRRKVLTGLLCKD